MYMLWRSDDLTNATTHNHFILAFIIMQLVGAALLMLILLTALISKHVKRDSTWYSFIASWMFSSICYCLLFFAGQQTGKPPNAALCTVQGALIYAAPALTPCTTLSLVIHMYLKFRAYLHTSDFTIRLSTELVLISMPYLVWAVVFTGILVFELQNPETVRRSPRGTYCDSTFLSIAHITSGVALVATVLILLLLCFGGYRMFWSRRHLLREGAILPLLVRVFAFVTVGILAIGLALAFVVTDDHGGIFDLLIASIPLSAVLIFGTQQDLIRVWVCHRSRNKVTPEVQHLRPVEYPLPPEPGQT